MIRRAPANPAVSMALKATVLLVIVKEINVSKSDDLSSIGPKVEEGRKRECRSR